MRSLILALLFWGVNSNAEIGNKIELMKESGTPKLSIQYALDAGKMISFTFAVLGNQLVGDTAASIFPVYWAIADKSSGSLLTPWSDAGFPDAYVMPGSTQAFTFSVGNVPTLKQTLTSLRNSVLVLSLRRPSRSPTPTLYIDLQEFCSSYPANVLSLDTFKTGCP